MPLVHYSRPYYKQDGSFTAWIESTLGYDMTDEEVATKLREIEDERIVNEAKYEASEKARRQAHECGS